MSLFGNLTNSFGRPFTKELYGTASEFNRI